MSTPLHRKGRLAGAAFVVGFVTVSMVPIQAATASTVLRVTNCLDDGSAGSLRQIVANASAGSTIVFRTICPPSVTPIILSPSSGPIDINKDLSIVGPGMAGLGVSGGGASRVFQVDAGVTATISGITIEKGNTFDGTGGGIDNGGTLKIADCDLSGNTTNGAGGGINSSGSLTLNDSTVSDNSATVAAGGIFNNGGVLKVDNSILSGNSATTSGGGGGAIFNYLGTVTISNSGLSGNSAPLYGGGGIWNDNGMLTVSESTMSGNDADGGGAIWNDVGTLKIGSSTIFGNTATLGGGGAIYQGGIIQGGGSTTINNSTLADNISTGRPDNTPYPGVYNNPTPPIGTITVHSSTIVGGIELRRASF